MPEVKCAFDKMISVKELKMNPQNPNMHPAEQIKLLAKVISKNGWRLPITVSNLSGYIVRGHAKLMAAKILQCTEVPVDYQDYKSNADELADLIADRRIAELAELNEDALVALISDIEKSGIDLELTGYSLDELDDIMIKLGIDNKKKDPGANVDKADELWDKWRPEKGVAWNIGKHRLMCGDITCNNNVMMLMENKKADMIFTDPPYNMDYRSKKLGGIDNDRLNEAAFVRLILSSTHSMMEALREGGSYYICMSLEEYGTVIHQLRKLGYKGVPIIWAKPSIGLGAQEYRPQIESLIYGYKGGRKKRIWHGERKESNLWEFDADRGVIARKTGTGETVLEFGFGYNTITVILDREVNGTVIGYDAIASDIWKEGREPGEYIHPTQKPVALVKRAILNSTKRGDLVLDGFLGSGTTMVAAEETGRMCYGIELNKKNVAVIMERMFGMGIEPEAIINEKRH